MRSIGHLRVDSVSQGAVFDRRCRNWNAPFRRGAIQPGNTILPWRTQRRGRHSRPGDLAGCIEAQPQHTRGQTGARSTAERPDEIGVPRQCPRWSVPAGIENVGGGSDPSYPTRLTAMSSRRIADCSTNPSTLQNTRCYSQFLRSYTAPTLLKIRFLMIRRRSAKYRIRGLYPDEGDQKENEESSNFSRGFATLSFVLIQLTGRYE